MSQRSTNVWDLDDSPRPVPHATSLDAITRKAAASETGPTAHKVPSRSATVSMCKFRMSPLLLIVVPRVRATWALSCGDRYIIKGLCRMGSSPFRILELPVTNYPQLFFVVY
jgi:hypothetical protein